MLCSEFNNYFYMRIEEIKVLGKTGRVRVTLDDGTVFPLYKGELNRYHLMEGDGLSEDAYNHIVEETLLERAKNRAAYLLQKSDRTESNLRQKLKEGYYPDNVIDRTISMLKEYGYVDDLEYAKSYIRTYEASKSRKVISMKLMEKGVKKETIEEAFESEYHTDETEIIKNLLEKRHYAKETADRKEREKTIRYLLGRGFSYDSFSDYI